MPDTTGTTTTITTTTMTTASSKLAAGDDTDRKIPELYSVAPEPTVERGVVLAKRPAPGASRRATLRRLLGYLLADKLRIGLSVLAVFVAVGCNVAIPALLGAGVNRIADTGVDQGVAMIVLGMLALALVSWACLFVNGLLVSRVAQRAMYDMRRDLFGRLQALSVAFFDRRPVGEVMSRLVNDIGAVNQFFSVGITQLLQSTFLVLFIVPVMIILSVPLAIAVLVIVPLMIYAVSLLGRTAGPAFAALQHQLGELNGLTEECLNGATTLQAYGGEDAAIERLIELSEATRRADRRANFFGSMAMPFTTALANLDIAVVSAVGGWLVIRGEIEVGLVATFLGYARQFSSPLIQLSNLTNFTLQAIAGGARVFEILDEVPAIVDRPDAAAFPHAEGEVDFAHVDFSYTPTKKILHDNTFHAAPGELIGLCGPTGAGKSTIINVLTRFYDVQSGTISIDGTDITTVRQDDLRRRTGIVLQVPFLFSGSVRENIRYGRPDATDAEVEQAARDANAHEFIERLPRGYDTAISPGARNLSQGQAQLVTIARAILAEPDILILDEATSSVDTRTERKIQEALDRLMAGRTSFVIAHRLSTIRNAARILVIDAGRIVQQGPHDELVGQEGLYRTLFTGQFKTELLGTTPTGPSGSTPPA
jgi:ATP-binding cassette subfamily B protein